LTFLDDENTIPTPLPHQSPSILRYLRRHLQVNAMAIEKGEKITSDAMPMMEYASTKGFLRWNSYNSTE
jgi:hypothetical protein